MNMLTLHAWPGTIRRTVSAALLLTGFVLHAQTPVRRIANLDASTSVQVPGTRLGAVAKATDLGRLAADTSLNGLTLHFAPSAEQRTDLDQLLLSQQDKSSPNYHRWLTPAEFAARFGASAEDVATVTQWLASQHFTVISATPLHIQFSGTVAEAEAAFHTQMHSYTLPAVAASKIAARSFIANATPISLPASLAQAITGISHLSTLRPLPLHRDLKLQKITPEYTSSTGEHALVPDDVRTIYNVTPLYTAGYTGAGQTIAVVGQSTIDVNDISEFNSIFGGHNTNLITTLVPGTGAAVNDTNDETESDLDLEYSGSMAKDATVLFFYAGASGDAFDAIAYAVDQNAAPVISISYGACEPNFGSSNATTLELILDQGNAQGQTLIAASGDAGATGCDADEFSAANQGLAVQAPSDSPDVTGIGGLEFNESNGTYWNTSNDAGYGSALGYIPEMVWNDSAITLPALEGVSGGGGGSSIFFSKPSWQVAVGVPADGARDIPDVSLAASGAHDPYFLCGPPDSNGNDCSNGYIYEAGGTSFGAPIFSGIVALIGQARGIAQGNINSQIYAMSASTPAAFHDITVGDNESPCTSGSTDCPNGTTAIGYSATTGYDLASGLGSIDVYAFAQAFSGYGSAAPLAATTAGLKVNPTAPTASNSLSFSATIASTTSGTPTGAVQFYIDSVAQGTAVKLASGTAAFTSPALSAGPHTVAVRYSGDGTYAAVGDEVDFIVSPLPVTSTVLTISPLAPNTTSTIVVTAKTSATATGTPTGTVQYSLDGASIGSPQTISGGLTSYTLGTLTAGQHSVQAVYSGDTNFASSLGVSTFTVGTVNQAQISLAISTAIPSTADSIAATATVNATATGTVQFTVDGTSVGSAVAVTGGFAIGELGKLTAGAHTIGASYSGDTNFGGNSTSIQISVTSSASAFTLSATSVAMSGTQSAASTVTVQSATNYAGTVLLTLTGSGPSNLCYTIGASPTVKAGASASSTVRFFTGSGCTSPNVRRLNSTQLASHSNPYRKGVELACSLGGFLLIFGARKRKHLQTVGLAMGVLCIFGLITGCGGSATSNETTPVSGTYTLTLTGTDSVNTTNTASTSFTLTE